MAIFEAEGTSSAGGMKWAWSATYDSTLNDLTVNSTLVSLETGQPVSPTGTMIATVGVTQANNQERSLNCVPIMNLGPQFDGNVNLKVSSSGRWSGFEVNTRFHP